MNECSYLQTQICKALLGHADVLRPAPAAAMHWQFNRLCRTHGAYLSIEYEFPQDLPPSPPPQLGLGGVSGEFGAAPAGP